MKRAKIKVVAVVLIGAIALSGGIVLSSPAPASYSFVTVDHPIDMWRSADGTWAYFAVGSGATSDLAAKARLQLLQLGFREDNSKRPWFRFVKGDEEVVICDHSEFAVNGSFFGSTLDFGRPSQTPREKQWPCVLVKNGPGTHCNVLVFQVKKLIHGW